MSVLALLLAELCPVRGVTQQEQMLDWEVLHAVRCGTQNRAALHRCNER